MKLLILAAGKGKRLNSDVTHIPKVMRTALGKPLLQYVLEYTSFIKPEDKTIIVGYMKDVITNAYPEYKAVEQVEQKGTGHAVMCAEECYKDYDGDLLVISGDMPLLTEETLKKLIKKHQDEKNTCTLLTFVIDGEIPPFGHITRNADGTVSGIVEHKDATPEQKLIRELNSGIYLFSSKLLFEALKKVEKSPVTGELYLTDAPKILIKDGEKVGSCIIDNPVELMGVNDEKDLAAVEAILTKKKNG